MEGLVIAETIQVLVVLVEDFLVVFAVLVRVEIVEESEEHLEGNQRVRASLMLATHSYNVELLGDFFESTIQTELVHERFDIEHVGCVVLEVLFELLARRW